MTKMLYEVLAARRYELGITIRGLKKMTGLQEAIISRIETGKSERPQFHVIISLAKALDLSLDYLGTLKIAEVPEKQRAAARRRIKKTWKQQGDKMAASIGKGLRSADKKGTNNRGENHKRIVEAQKAIAAQ